MYFLSSMVAVSQNFVSNLILCWLVINIFNILNILIELPVIKPFSFPDNSKAGDSLSVTCSVTSGDKPLSFVWMKENKEVKDGTNTKILTHTALSVLAIDPLNEENRGNYTCVVTNAVGKASYTANLQIPVPPTWLEEPKNTEVIANGNVTILCQAYGFPSPSVTWIKKENPFDSSINVDSKIIIDKGKLTFIKITKNDEGLYECTASNGIGIALKKTISLSIKGINVKN